MEPYVLWRLENAAGVRLDEKTVGFRWTGTLPWGFDYGSEVAGQTGSADADRVRAWAGHWVAGHTLPDARHKPRLFAEFNRASGDGNSRDGVRRGFDPLFPSTHDKLGVTDLFTWTNLLHWRNGFEYTVRPSIKVGVAYNSFWLADGRDGLYSGGKAVARRADGTAGTHIGQQGDLQATWTAPLGTQVSGGYGRLFAGEFLRQTTAGYAYNVFFCAIGRRF